MTINGDDVRRAFKKLSDEYVGLTHEISRVPGLAIAVVYLGDSPYTATRCAGVRSIVDGGDIDADTLFQLASLSKPISSTVVAAQVAREEVAWVAPVAKLDPRFPMGIPASRSSRCSRTAAACRITRAISLRTQDTRAARS
jgi:CubicO group peptidase (beta-lactamase class C family)